MRVLLERDPAKQSTAIAPELQEIIDTKTREGATTIEMLDYFAEEIRRFQ